MFRIVLSTLFYLLVSTLVFAQTEIEIIRDRVAVDILENLKTTHLYSLGFKGTADDDPVQKLINDIQTDGTWLGINYDDVSALGFEHRYHLGNLMTMALSYSNQESKHFKNRKLKKSINLGLRHWCDKNYVCGNWWYNVVYSPTILSSIYLIMEDDLDPELFNKAQQIIKIANKENPWARPSGDRVKICSIEAKNYLITGEKDKLAEIIEVIEDEIKLSTGRRGVQIDLSHHHRVHRVNTSTTYGLSYAQACTEWASFLAGTKFAFSEENVEFITDFYLDGICKQLVYGKSEDKNVANRHITRPEHETVQSTVIPEKLLKVGNYRTEEIKEIIDLRNGKLEKPTLSFCKYFWQSEHLVFQRPDFYTSVRMYSTRNRNMELAHNSEGIKNHHKSDGANFLSVSGTEYKNIWPVYDWQKIPGTTVLQKPELPNQHKIQKDGLSNFVGAATDGFYGVAGFDFISPHDNIRVKKSWFFFDEEYVCLGAGIASNDFNKEVVTTLDQVLLSGEVIVEQSDNQQILVQGEHQIEQASWVYHNGTAYVFPKPTDIHLSNQKEQGRWSDINKQANSSKELVQKEVLKLWIDHGKRPQGESLWFTPSVMDTKDVTYQYIVIPNIQADQIDSDRGVEILANSSKIQAVRNTKLGIVQVVFYEAGSLELKSDLVITMDSPGILMLMMDGKQVKKLTVSDPSRKLGKMHFSISGVKEFAIELPKGDFAGNSVTLNTYPL